ncbi:MAG: NAD(P)H-hydrate dehydratase [Oscillospiraceae bacterium]|nr:NAD(P)H-hydrate dehydratase [Ruminococcus sp.]MCD8346010.1 NAD(P)H-hydrate dehydratase [Oscillospiraceae bacterium]
MNITSTISWEALYQAELEANKNNVHISAVLEPDGGDISSVDKYAAEAVMRENISSRPVNSHKGTFGRLLSIVGSNRYPGAAAISSLSALRSGVGLLSVCTTEHSAISLASNVKECTLFPCHCDEDGFIKPTDHELEGILDLLKASDAVLIGCGLGQSESTIAVLEAVIENANCPIIIDADGINLVSKRIELLRKAKTDVILTPHPAELSRLAQVDTKTAVKERYTIAKKLASQYSVTIVSKSCSTLIVNETEAYVTMFGNNGLSKGGSGDLLAGLISSFVAQGKSPVTAGILGTYAMGASCEEVSKRRSKTGMLASDIISYLPELFKNFERA